jgi:hypothetical protein
MPELRLHLWLPTVLLLRPQVSRFHGVPPERPP